MPTLATTSKSKPPVRIPQDAARCRKCTILMPIPGIVQVSQRDPSLCSDCAGEGTIYSRALESDNEIKEKTTMTQKNSRPNTPPGWGPIERRPLMPREMGEEYGTLLLAIDEMASKEWARVEAPTKAKATYLSTKLKDLRPQLERACRLIDGKHYVYFRLKENGHETD